MKKVNWFKQYELNKTLTGNVSWFFHISIILSIALFILNITITYLSPSKINDIQSNDIIFLGYYSLNVSTGKMFLNWAPYICGILAIVLVCLNCLIYYMIISAGIRPYVNVRELMCFLISGVVIVVLLFILNIFNKPTIFTHLNFDLVKNGFNPDVTKLNLTVQFNYVYDINFISDGAKTITSYITLNYFNIIWIIGMVGCILVWVISLFMFLYSKQINLSIMLRKD